MGEKRLLAESVTIVRFRSMSTDGRLYKGREKISRGYLEISLGPRRIDTRLEWIVVISWYRESADDYYPLHPRIAALCNTKHVSHYYDSRINSRINSRIWDICNLNFNVSLRISYVPTVWHFFRFRTNRLTRECKLRLRRKRSIISNASG